MEQIIKFLEEFWGVTIVGGLSVGTLITFVVVQIKSLIKDKHKNTNIDKVLNKTEELCDELNTREAKRTEEIEALTAKVEVKQKEIEVKQKEIADREAYFEQVQAAIFKAISYLIVSSKLPTEDKIAIQTEFTNLLNNKKVEYQEILKDELADVQAATQAIVEEVKTTIIPDAKETVANVVNTTKSLLDKYTKAS
jgi:uncharacterized membrane protein YgaE (UPF0421/DUF939 family)